MKKNNVLLPIAIAAAGVFLLKKKSTTDENNNQSKVIVRVGLNKNHIGSSRVEYVDFRKYLKRITIIMQDRNLDSFFDKMTDTECAIIYCYMYLGDLSLKTSFLPIATKYDLDYVSYE